MSESDAASPRFVDSVESLASIAPPSVGKPLYLILDPSLDGDLAFVHLPELRLIQGHELVNITQDPSAVLNWRVFLVKEKISVIVQNVSGALIAMTSSDMRAFEGKKEIIRISPRVPEVPSQLLNLAKLDPDTKLDGDIAEPQDIRALNILRDELKNQENAFPEAFRSILSWDHEPGEPFEMSQAIDRFVDSLIRFLEEKFVAPDLVEALISTPLPDSDDDEDEALTLQDLLHTFLSMRVLERNSQLEKLQISRVPEDQVDEEIHETVQGAVAELFYRMIFMYRKAAKEITDDVDPPEVFRYLGVEERGTKALPAYFQKVFQRRRQELDYDNSLFFGDDCANPPEIED